MIMHTYRESGLKDCHEQIDFQRDFTEDVAKEADYGRSLDVAALFHTWEGHKHDNILTYRDQGGNSIDIFKVATYRQVYRAEPKEPTQFGSVAGSEIQNLPFSHSGIVSLYRPEPKEPT